MNQDPDATRQTLNEVVRTANCITRSEDSRYLGVELYVHVPGIRHLLMAGIHLLIHPVRKWLAYLCVDDICHILARELEDLTIHSWERFPNNLIACSEHQHVLDCKTAELWDHNVFHLDSFDPPLLSTSEITQVPNGDIVIWW